jgi:hypothetical protein
VHQLVAAPALDLHPSPPRLGFGPCRAALTTSCRPLRLGDGGWGAAAAAGVLRGCLHQEQDALGDAALGAMSGTLMSAALVHSCQRDVHARLDTPAARAARDARAEIFAETDWRTAFRTEEVRVPPDWRGVVGGNSTTLKWLELRMPNTRGWPARLGGDWSRAFGAPLHGNATVGSGGANGTAGGGGGAAAFLAQLARDCPDCPSWPDPYNSSLAEAADAVPPERLLLLPLWLGHGFALSGTRLRGSEGLWDARTLDGPPRQVMGHVWAVPGGEFGKRAVHMALGELDWRTAERVREVTTGGVQSAAWSACTNHPLWYGAAGNATATSADADGGRNGSAGGGRGPLRWRALADSGSGGSHSRRRGGGSGNGGGAVGAQQGANATAADAEDACDVRLLALHPSVSAGCGWLGSWECLTGAGRKTRRGSFEPRTPSQCRCNHAGPSSHLRLTPRGSRPPSCRRYFEASRAPRRYSAARPCGPMRRAAPRRGRCPTRRRRRRRRRSALRTPRPLRS